MRHIKTLSRPPIRAEEGQTDIFETIIIVVLSVIFKDWDNFASVIQNLQKYYSKTP